MGGEKMAAGEKIEYEDLGGKNKKRERKTEGNYIKKNRKKALQCIAGA